MKKDFLTGLAILLPVVLTILIALFFINLLTEPFMGIVRSIFKYYGLMGTSFFFLSSDQIINLISKILVLISLFLVTLLIGFFAQHFFIDVFFRNLDRLIHRIPFVNKIYKAFQEVMHTIFHPTSTTFSQVVLAPYPHKKTYAVGFIAKEALPEGSDTEHLDLISVFIPGTPNPMMGFNLLYKREQLVFVNTKVDDALKFVISCGVMYTGFFPEPQIQQDISGT